MENRGQASTLKQIAHLEANLPFSLLGLDSDNGGGFINHHLAAYLAQRQHPAVHLGLGALLIAGYLLADSVTRCVRVHHRGS